MILLIFVLFSILNSTMDAINKNNLTPHLHKPHPFPYDLGIKIRPKNTDAGVMICIHGYGSSNHIADVIDSFKNIPDHIVGLNLPDHGIVPGVYDVHKSSFGTINEILPVLYVIKQCVIEAKLESINLYGFSAGGALIINLLSVLNTTTYDTQLAGIGISKTSKQKIKSAIEHGHIILECPMKSIDEIMDHRGHSKEFTVLAKRYKENTMRPIDVLTNEKFNVPIIVHFAQPDDILGNRDDQLFIDRLRNANTGKTEVVLGTERGHNMYHQSLWNRYKEFRKNLS